MAGEVVITVDSGRGLTRVQLAARSATEERESIALYRKLKPVLETIAVHIPPPSARKGKGT